MVDAGLQALDDAKSSNDRTKVAQRYMEAFFNLRKDTSSADEAFVKSEWFDAWKTGLAYRSSC
jgi:hypothetical protein